MADFEMFGGMDEGGEGVDPAAFEKFKERVKAASAQIKADKKKEQKQKKKEDQLIKILLQFVKKDNKRDIMLLIARLLEQNIPPLFILSIVLLGHKDVGKELGIDLAKPLLEGEKAVDDKSLVSFTEDMTLPLKAKAEIDNWMKYILKTAMEEPQKIYKRCLNADETTKLPLLQLTSFILRDYLHSMQIESDYEKLKEFSDFFLSAVMKRLKEMKVKEISNKKEE